MINKKGNTQIFTFFLSLTIISGLLFFFLIGMHFLLYDYGIGFGGDLGKQLLTPLNATNQISNINATQAAYLNNGRYFDMLFLVVIVSMFIESVIGAVQARKYGVISFFGLLTIGNILLIFIMSYILMIRDWFVNEFVLNLITVAPDTPFITMFFNYTYFIVITWYVILLVLTQIDFSVVTEKLTTLLSKKQEGGRIEE